MANYSKRGITYFQNALADGKRHDVRSQTLRTITAEKADMKEMMIFVLVDNLEHYQQALKDGLGVSIIGLTCVEDEVQSYTIIHYDGNDIDAEEAEQILSSPAPETMDERIERRRSDDFKKHLLAIVNEPEVEERLRQMVDRGRDGTAR